MTDVKLHMLASVNNKQMQSFIIEHRRAQKIIVIDGGRRIDADKLIEKLREITGKPVPHVDAWILTHPHSDHVDAFYKIVEVYDKCVTFDNVYLNFPSEQYLKREKEDTDAPLCAYTLRTLLPKIGDRLITVSKGDVYTVGDVQFEFLYTADCSVKNNRSNNSSAVFKMYVNKKSILFLGDLGVEGGEILLKTYGDKLKSDVCQMAHHGQEGVTLDVYTAINPTVCLWCAPDWLWNNDRGNGFNTAGFTTITTREWMQNLGATEHYTLVDGDNTITI